MSVRVQQEIAHRIAERRAARLTEHRVRDAVVIELRGETPELGGLPRSFAALEHDEPTARRHAQPNVMIELVAPFLMPSRIHWFTCTITLSKFSFDAMTRW